MNANTVFENFLKKMATINSLEEKEYAMIEALDSLSESYDEEEKMYIWNQMLNVA